MILETLELWPFTIKIFEIMGMLGKAGLDAMCSLRFSSVYSFFPRCCLAAEASAFGDPFDQRHRLEIRL